MSSTEKKNAGYVPYEERLCIVMSFFGISKPAASFLYHRKRRGYPFKKKDDPKFLEWSLQLQNALVKADECIGWDWEELRFGNEDKMLAQHDIFIDKQSDKDIFKNETPENDGDGWTVVKNDKKIKQRQNKALQIMGFIPRPRVFRKNKRRKPKVEDEKTSV